MRGGARRALGAPTLVAEVAFTEWTEGGKIRHPSFQGLREDKPARSVVRERAASAPLPADGRRAGTAAGPAGDTSPAAPVEVRGVVISNPQRVMFPDAGITKLDLVRYVDADRRLDVAARRRTAAFAVFCPDGIAGECAFLKHGKTWGPKTLRRVKIREKTKIGEYMVADTDRGARLDDADELD